MSIDRDTSTTVTLGNRTVSVPTGGLFDRYRMQTDLDEVARDPRVGGVEFFRDQPKVEVQSAIGPTFTPNFYYAMSSARLTMLAPTSALRDRLPTPLDPLEVVPGFGLASLILFRYDVADIDFYTEAAVGIAVKPLHHGPLGAIDLIAALKNSHLDSYVLSLPVNTEIAQVRGHDGYGFPKWVTDIDVDITAQSVSGRVLNDSGGIDVELHAPTPRQKRHRSGTAVSSLTSYTHFDGGWHGTFNQTNALVSGTTLFPRDIDLRLGEGRVSDDLRSLRTSRALMFDVMTHGQAALHMPRVISLDCPPLTLERQTIVSTLTADRRLTPRITTDRLAALARRVEVADPASTQDVTNAMTGEVLSTVPHGTEADIVAAAERARTAQQAWAERPIKERARVLMRFHDLVLAHQDEVLDLIQLENGKARRHAFEEIMDVAINARYYAHTAERILRPKRRQGVQLGLTKVWELHHPKGVVGVISPWNYPLTLGISDALPALVAGNAVLAKPDAQTPFSALWAVELLERAGMQPGLVQVVTGSGAELGRPIIENSDFLMFTGSTAVGRTVAAQAGENLIESSMELGGKNALLVLDDADVDKAVSGALRASFSNTGQLCISMERIYVPGVLWDEFTTKFAAAAQAMTLSAGIDYSGDMGSLVSQKQLDTVVRHVEDAKAKGATVLAGGNARPDLGPFFFEPTILTDVDASMEVFAHETFGPVVSLYRVADEEEAIAKANDSDYGLNFSVWTSDEDRGVRVASRLEAGTVNVNDAYAAAWGSVDAPMGGMKASGLGRRHGEHGILKYTESQTIAASRLLPVGAPDKADPARYARVVTGALRVLKQIPGVK